MSINELEFKRMQKRVEQLERLVVNLLDIDYRQRIRNNTFAFGDGTDSDIIILAYNADANMPGLKYDHVANAWKRSNDGMTWIAF